MIDYLNDNSKLFIEFIHPTHSKRNTSIAKTFKEYYQLLSVNATAKYDYTSIAIGFEYSGMNDIYVTGFELYKSDYVNDLEYDELKRLKQNASKYIYYYDGKPELVVSTNGEVQRYEYDNNNLIKEEDIYNNKIIYTYNENNKLTKAKTILNSDEEFEQTYTSEENKELKRRTKEDNK